MPFSRARRRRRPRRMFTLSFLLTLSLACGMPWDREFAVLYPAQATAQVVQRQVKPEPEPAPAPTPGPRQQRLSRWIRTVNPSVPREDAKSLARLIVKKADHYQVDYQLVASLVAAESRFNVTAVSPVGARGLGQLMPGTARDLGVRDSFDPEQNLDGCVRYLAGLIARWERVDLALASYNAGPGAVARFRGIPPYRETRQYVKRIKTYYHRLAQKAPSAHRGRSV